MSAPCDELLLHKQGLDLRLTEFREQHRRILETHEALTNRLAQLETEELLAKASRQNPMRALLKKQAGQLKQQSRVLVTERREKQILQDDVQRLRNWFAQVPVSDLCGDGGVSGGFRKPSEGDAQHGGMSGGAGKANLNYMQRGRRPVEVVDTSRISAGAVSSRNGSEGAPVSARSPAADSTSRDESVLPKFLRSPSRVPLPKTPGDEEL
mmetsp:Transcript_7830/g.18893  ORF Transcript_7830/g.18893 Transcript_7830/m.18893 type:complete len:210 (+) Transcript_7830:89-718(+)